MKAPLILLVAATLLATSGCSEKPCTGIPATDDVKRLDVLIEGGQLCKDDKGVASIDFPGKDIAAVKKSYVSHLEGKGWKTENDIASDKLPIVVFAKDKDKMMVTIGKSSERHVTFALVKHCPVAGSPMAAGCVEQVTKLGEALAKNKD